MLLKCRFCTNQASDGGVGAIRIRKKIIYRPLWLHVVDNRYLCRISNGTVQLSWYLFFIAYCASHACVEYLEQVREAFRGFPPVSLQGRLVDEAIITIIIIITTRPKPAYGWQGLAGSWGQDTNKVSNFWVFLTSHFAQLGNKPTWDHS